jgi:hypothetical protein
MANDNRNNKQNQKEQSDNKQIGRSGRRPGSAPRTTETGGQNSGGQTERARDNSGNKRRGAGK